MSAFVINPYRFAAGLAPRNDIRVSRRDFTSATAGIQTVTESPRPLAGSSSFAGWRAFDSSSATAWLTDSGAGYGLPQWLKIDFGQDETIYSVMYDVRDDGGGVQSPKDFKIQSSDDDSVWIDRLTVTNATQTNGQLNYDLDTPAIARYWRIYVTSVNSAENRVGLAIMEYYS